MSDGWSWRYLDITEVWPTFAQPCLPKGTPRPGPEVKVEALVLERLRFFTFDLGSIIVSRCKMHSLQRYSLYRGLTPSRWTRAAAPTLALEQGPRRASRHAEILRHRIGQQRVVHCTCGLSWPYHSPTFVQASHNASASHSTNSDPIRERITKKTDRRLNLGRG